MAEYRRITRQCAKDDWSKASTHAEVRTAHRSENILQQFFRHNRRSTPMVGFQTLLGLGLAHDPVTYRQIIDQAA